LSLLFLKNDIINSYLIHRKQFVSLNQNHFEVRNIQYGMPQGSSLGPLFFLIHVNNITNALNCKPILFADDTCLLVKASNPQDLQNKINKELKNLNDWCSANKLTIIPSKSNALIIFPKLKRKSELQLIVHISGTPVNIVKKCYILRRNY